MPENNGERGKRGHSKNPIKSFLNSLRRAQKSIFEYAVANDWDFWGTFTLDKVKIDRYDLDVIQKELTIFLMNTRAKKFKNLKWLIVPETHKNGAWHFHLLLSGLPEVELRYIGKTYKNTGRKMFNWIEYENKFGFNSLIDIRNMPLDQMYKIANYLTKYMTKEIGLLRFNKKKYWSSKGLQRPNKINRLLSYEEYQEFINNISTSDIIRYDEYYCKDKQTGEIFNTVTEIVRLNLPF